MVIDFNLLARLAKLVALFAFFMPWVAVSCSGTEILTGTGMQLMTGDLQPSGPIAAMQEQAAAQGQADPDSQKADPSIFVIIAFAVILIGLAVSLFTRRRIAAGVLLGFSVLAVGLCFYSVENMQSEMAREISQQQDGMSAGAAMDSNIPPGMEDMQAAMATAIQIEKRSGYWATIIALVAAAVFALLTLATRIAPPKTEAPAAPG